MTSVQERLKLRRQPTDVWNTYEQLCLASSVLKSGNQNWSSVSRSLRGLIDKDGQKPPDWYSSKACAQQYSLLLENAEKDLENPKRKKRERGETTGELIVRQLTQDRIQELQKIMQEQKNEYLNLKSEYKILSTGTISEEKLQKMWIAIEEEERAKEPKPQLLLNIQNIQKKVDEPEASAEAVPEEEEKKKGGRSPLLTSLLKSPSPTKISAPVINAPTLSMLLEQPTPAKLSLSQEAKESLGFDSVKQEEEEPKNITSVDNTDEINQIIGDIEEIINEDLQKSAQEGDTKQPRNIDEPVSLSDSPVSEMAIEIDSSSSNIAEIIGTAIQAAPEQIIPESKNEEQSSDSCTESKNEEGRPAAECRSENFSGATNCGVPDQVSGASESSLLYKELVNDSSSKDDLEAMETLSDKTTVMDEHDIEKAENAVADFEEFPSNKQQTEFPESSTPEIYSVSSMDDAESPKVPKVQTSEPVEITKPEGVEKIETDSILENDTENSSEEVTVKCSNPSEDCSSVSKNEIESNNSNSQTNDLDETLDSTLEIDSSKQKSEIDSDEMNLVNNDERDEIKPNKADDIDMAKVNEIIEDSKLEIKKEIVQDFEVKKVPELESIKVEKTESLGSNEDYEDELEPTLSKSGRAVKTYSKRQNVTVDSETESESGLESSSEYRAWRKSVLLFFNKFASSKNASIFQKPITEDQAPGYHAVIYRPMDLSTIKKNIDNGTIRTTTHFQRDVMLMFQNAIMYNKSDSHVYRMTLEMLKECKHDFQILGNVYGETSGESLPLKRETRTATSVGSETVESAVKRKWSHASHTHTDSDSPRIKKRRRSEND